MARNTCDRQPAVLRATLVGMLCLVASMVCGQHVIHDVDMLREGDLIFHVSDSSNAITTVTTGSHLPIDHVSIFTRRGGRANVIEAIGRGVVQTPIDSVLARSGYHLVGRVRHLARRSSVRRAMRYIGRGYDHYFLTDNDEIYCSELVSLAYRTRGGKACFPLIPMSFHDESGTITPYWREHYAKVGMDVPEGSPGTNPSELSRRSNVRIMWILKKVDKK